MRVFAFLMALTTSVNAQELSTGMMREIFSGVVLTVANDSIANDDWSRKPFVAGDVCKSYHRAVLEFTRVTEHSVIANYSAYGNMMNDYCPGRGLVVILTRAQAQQILTAYDRYHSDKFLESLQKR